MLRRNLQLDVGNKLGWENVGSEGNVPLYCKLPLLLLANGFWHDITDQHMHS